MKKYLFLFMPFTAASQTIVCDKCQHGDIVYSLKGVPVLMKDVKYKEGDFTLDIKRDTAFDIDVQRKVRDDNGVYSWVTEYFAKNTNNAKHLVTLASSTDNYRILITYK